MSPESRAFGSTPWGHAAPRVRARHGCVSAGAQEVGYRLPLRPVGVDYVPIRHSTPLEPSILIQFRPMKQISRRLVVATATLAVLCLGACSGGGSPTEQAAAPVTPKISTPVDSPSTPPATASAPSNNQFTKAVEFSRLVWNGEDEQAGALVADNTPAARYIVHQINYDKALRVSGLDNEIVGYTIKGDEKTGAVSIEGEDDDETFVWKSFTFDSAGKVTGWSTPNGPIAKILWSRESSDESVGAKGRLVSAYRTTSGGVTMVVEMSATKTVQLGYTAEYAPTGDYKQQSTDQSSIDSLAKGEKTLLYYYFEDAKFGGKLTIPVSSGKNYDSGTITLRIR